MWLKPKAADIKSLMHAILRTKVKDEKYQIGKQLLETNNNDQNGKIWKIYSSMITLYNCSQAMKL
jgi:hypothetical protein